MQAYNHLDKADTFDVDATVADAGVEDYDGLVLPGGVANPDRCGWTPAAVAFARGVLRRRQAGGRHLPRTVDARRGRVVRGRPLTSWPSLQTDIRNAGGDLGRRGGRRRQTARALVSSRKPDDLPAFTKAIADAF